MDRARGLAPLGLALLGLVALAVACTGRPDAGNTPSPAPTVATVVAGELRSTLQDNVAPSPCSSAETQQTVYADSTQGYCFAFPSQFLIGEVTTRTVSLQNPQVSETTPVLTVRVDPVNAGQSLEQIVNDRLLRAKSQQPNLMIKRRSTQLGGLSAEEIIGLPGRPEAHWLFVLRDGNLVTLLFRPSRSGTQVTRSAEQALWQQVTETFRFY